MTPLFLGGLHHTIALELSLHSKEDNDLHCILISCKIVCCSKIRCCDSIHSGTVFIFYLETLMLVVTLGCFFVCSGKFSRVGLFLLGFHLSFCFLLYVLKLLPPLPMLIIIFKLLSFHPFYSVVYSLLKHCLSAIFVYCISILSLLIVDFLK